MTLHDHNAQRVPCNTGLCTLRSLSSMSNTFGLSLLRCAAGDPKPSSELKDVNDAALVSMCILSKSYSDTLREDSSRRKPRLLPLQQHMHMCTVSSNVHQESC